MDVGFWLGWGYWFQRAAVVVFAGESFLEVYVEEVVVDGVVAGCGDFVVVEVDAFKNGLVEVTAGLVGRGEVLGVAVVEHAQAGIEGGADVVFCEGGVFDVAFGDESGGAELFLVCA